MTVKDHKVSVKSMFLLGGHRPNLARYATDVTNCVSEEKETRKAYTPWGCLLVFGPGSMSHMVWPVPPKWRPRMDPADQVEYPIGVGHNLGKNCMEEFWLSSVCAWTQQSMVFDKGVSWRGCRVCLWSWPTEYGMR